MQTQKEKQKEKLTFQKTCRFEHEQKRDMLLKAFQKTLLVNMKRYQMLRIQACLKWLLLHYLIDEASIVLQLCTQIAKRFDNNIFSFLIFHYNNDNDSIINCLPEDTCLLQMRLQRHFHVTHQPSPGLFYSRCICSSVFPQVVIFGALSGRVGTRENKGVPLHFQPVLNCHWLHEIR